MSDYYGKQARDASRRTAEEKDKADAQAAAAVMLETAMYQPTDPSVLGSSDSSSRSSASLSGVGVGNLDNLKYDFADSGNGMFTREEIERCVKASSAKPTYNDAHLWVDHLMRMTEDQRQGALVHIQACNPLLHSVVTTLLGDLKEEFRRPVARKGLVIPKQTSVFMAAADEVLAVAEKFAKFVDCDKTAEMSPRSDALTAAVDLWTAVHVPRVVQAEPIVPMGSLSSIGLDFKREQERLLAEQRFVADQQARMQQEMLASKHTGSIASPPLRAGNSPAAGCTTGDSNPLAKIVRMGVQPGKSILQAASCLIVDSISHGVSKEGIPEERITMRAEPKVSSLDRFMNTQLGGSHRLPAEIKDSPLLDPNKLDGEMRTLMTKVNLDDIIAACGLAHGAATGKDNVAPDAIVKKEG